MEQKLNTCINLLTKAKEHVMSNDPNIDLALDMLEKANDILVEFSQLEDEGKVEFKEKLIQIQALGQIINVKLAEEKDKLQAKVLQNTKMNNAVKGYSRG